MARNQVSMPSRANASLLRGEMIPMDLFVEVCQCPHGLMPHCYPLFRTSDCDVVMCQCPHGLMPHCYSTPSKT